MELAKEDFAEGKAMRATRDAAQNWEMECTEMIVEAGVKQGSYSARVFYRKDKSVRVIHHGDDFAVPGPSKSLGWFGGVAQEQV